MNKNMKRIVPLIMMLTITFHASAGDVTPEEAKTIAAGFLQTRQPTPDGRRNKQKQIGKEQLTVCDASRMVYAVSYGDDGFVLVGKDEAVCQVLGYSDDGAFDASQLPDAFKEMMADYDQEITIAAELARQGCLQAPRKITRHAIAPMITSKWSQGEAGRTGNVFNWKCPTELSVRCYTGCVATAMAQVMYYYKYPESTKMVIQDTWNGSLPVTSFDWENMIDQYLGSDLTDLTSILAEPIGKLMKYCGYAANMKYGRDASGANPQDMVYGMITYFGYNENAWLAYRRNYSIDAWNDLLYGELESGRPVLYGGSSSGGGHQFILDGIDTDGLYHVNWGWGGRFNGYFVLNLLNPMTTNDTGSSSTPDGYTMNQTAAIGMQPETIPGATTTNKLGVCSLWNNSDTLQLAIQNYTNNTSTYFIGAGAIDNDGNVTTLDNYHVGLSFNPNSGYYFEISFSTIASKLGNGTYRISGICSTDGANWNACDFAENIYAVITVEGGAVTSCILHPTGCDVTVSEGKLTGNGYVNVQQEVEVTFQNQSDFDYLGTVGLYLSDGSNLTTLSGLYLKANSSDKTNFYFTPISIGSHTLYLYEVNPDTQATIRRLGSITVSIVNPPDGGDLEGTLSVIGAVCQGGVNYVNNTMAEMEINVYNNKRTTANGYILIKQIGAAYYTSCQLMINPFLHVTIPYTLEGLEMGVTYTYEVYFNTSEDFSGAQLLSTYSFVVDQPTAPVVKEDQTLSMSSIPTMTYGASNYSLPSATEQGLTITWSSSKTSVATISNGNKLVIRGAGTATITASQAGNDDFNPFEQTFTLTVNKAQLTITADDKSMTAGENVPDLTFTCSGFVNGESSSVMTQQPTVTTTANSSSPAGTYPITVSGANAANYYITYVDGTLTIVAGCTPGDVNGDDEINGFDIVYLVDIIMGNPSFTFDFAAADLDGDGEINGFDLVELVDLILSQPVSGAKARRAPEMMSPAMNTSMLMSGKTDGSISVGVDSGESYILSQFMLELSDGQQLTDISASDRRHVVAYRAIDDNHYVVLCYSVSNAVFKDSRDMLTVSCEGSGTVRISDVMLIDSNKNPLLIGDAEFSEPTGIGPVNGIFSKPSDIYSISGTLVRKNASSISGLTKGFYVIDGKIVFIK